MKLTCYEYTWLDHAKCEGWKYEINKDPYYVHSVGYLIGEDKLHYFFTDGVVPSTGAYHGTMQVMKAVCKKKKLFTKEFK